MAVVINGTSGIIGGINSMSSQTATGTAVSFTSIPAGVKRVTIQFSGVGLSASSSYLVQLGTGSTSYVTTGYVSAGGQVSDASSASVLSSTAGYVVRSATSGRPVSGILVLENITSTTWVSSHSMGTNTTTVGFGGGTCSAGATLTAVRITTVNGTDTFASGSFNVFYE